MLRMRWGKRFCADVTFTQLLSLCKLIFGERIKAQMCKYLYRNLKGSQQERAVHGSNLPCSIKLARGCSWKSHSATICNPQQGCL